MSDLNGPVTFPGNKKHRAMKGVEKNRMAKPHSMKKIITGQLVKGMVKGPLKAKKAHKSTGKTKTKA